MGKEIKTKVVKNQTAKVGDKYSYKYVDIAQIHDYLKSINARYIQQIQRIDGDDYVMTKRCIDNEWESEWLQGCKVVDATLVGVKNPAQEQGSALTYARRYSLLMAFGLATEDDDAQCLTQENKEINEAYAKKYVLNFGKHKGEKLEDVIELDEDYIDWLLNNEKTDNEIKQCITLLTNKEPIDDETLQLQIELNRLMGEKNEDWDEMRRHYKAEDGRALTKNEMKDAISILKNIK